jgi:hypothetical protein
MSANVSERPEGWIALNPDDPKFGPETQTAVWITDGEKVALAVRYTPEQDACLFQMVLGFQHLRATHFAYAGPPAFAATTEGPGVLWSRVTQAPPPILADAKTGSGE